LKSRGVKVLIALGGWTDSKGNKYSRLVSSSGSRRNFISHVLQFIKKHNFDGLDLDWEYPACPQAKCGSGSASDKANFATFVSELRQAFNPHGYLLTAAVSAGENTISHAYDVPSLSRNLDWIGLMTYDFYGNWDSKTGHHSALKKHPADSSKFNADDAVKIWEAAGAPPNKLILGIPTYGRGFKLSSASSHGLNAASISGQGPKGQYTNETGYIAYYEVCAKVKSGWTNVVDSSLKRGPYTYRGTDWISYDDPDIVQAKSSYVKSEKLAGAMIWALDLDDFKNVCNCETYPLIKTINRVLRGYAGAKCGSGGTVAPTPAGKPTNTQAPATQAPTSGVSCSTPTLLKVGSAWSGTWGVKFIFPQSVNGGWELKVTFDSPTTSITTWSNNAEKLSGNPKVWRIWNKTWNKNMAKGANLGFQVSHSGGNTRNHIISLHLTTGGNTHLLCNKM